MRAIHSVTGIVVIIVAATHGQCLGEARYTVSRIGGSWYGSDFNSHGQYIGVQRPEVGPITSLIWQDGSCTRLGTLGGTATDARAINEAGLIVGRSQTGETDAWGHAIYRAFLWREGVMEDLGALGGRASLAWDINEAGQVVGSAETGDEPPGPYGLPVSRGFLWEDGSMTDLGTLGGVSSSAVAINASGMVVGASGTDDGTFLPFVWVDGQMTALDLPPGLGSGGASAVNDLGQVAGACFAESGEVVPVNSARAVLWNEGVAVRLEGLVGFESSSAADINNAGQVVGGAINYSQLNFRARAVLWEDGHAYDLNGLIPPDAAPAELSWAIAIDDDGRILAQAWSNPFMIPQSGTVYLLTPVPEPHVMLMLIAGSAWVAGRQQRR